MNCLIHCVQNGIMENWNNGIMLCAAFPLLHHSNIPSFHKLCNMNNNSFYQSFILEADMMDYFFMLLLCTAKYFPMTK